MKAKAQKDPPKTWMLKGSTERDNADRKVSFLSLLLDTAKTKGTEVAQLRQRNLNYALLIFGGLLAFSLQFASSWYSVWVSVSLLAMMCFFSLLDRRFHRYIHGWRETEKMFMDKITSVINDSHGDVEFVRYYKEGEEKAERFGLQPWITYLLVIGAVIHFVYCFVSAIKT